jgi:hypothetical protein
MGILRRRRRREQAVIVRESMGRDAEVADPRVSGQEHGDRRRDPPGARALVEAVRDGPRTEGLAGHGVGEGRIEFPGGVLVWIAPKLPQST